MHYFFLSFPCGVSVETESLCGWWITWFYVWLVDHMVLCVVGWESNIDLCTHVIPVLITEAAML